MALQNLLRLAAKLHWTWHDGSIVCDHIGLDALLKRCLRYAWNQRVFVQGFQGRQTPRAVFCKGLFLRFRRRGRRKRRKPKKQKRRLRAIAHQLGGCQTITLRGVLRRHLVGNENRTLEIYDGTVPSALASGNCPIPRGRVRYNEH